jgi:hypothetical protein
MHRMSLFLSCSILVNEEHHVCPARSVLHISSKEGTNSRLLDRFLYYYLNNAARICYRTSEMVTL